jgi:hypothetical protein
MKPPYNITINFGDVGCFVTVGCKTLCYQDNQQMLIDLAAYVNNPKETIKLMQEQHPGLKEQRGADRHNPYLRDELRERFETEVSPPDLVGMPSGAAYPETGN